MIKIGNGKCWSDGGVTLRLRILKGKQKQYTLTLIMVKCLVMPKRGRGSEETWFAQIFTLCSYQITVTLMVFAILKELLTTRTNSSPPILQQRGITIVSKKLHCIPVTVHGLVERFRLHIMCEKSPGPFIRSRWRQDTRGARYHFPLLERRRVTNPVSDTKKVQGQTKPQKAGVENLTGNIEFPWRDRISFPTAFFLRETCTAASPASDLFSHEEWQQIGK